LERCRPIYEEHSGWDKPTAGATSLDALPEGARSYVKRIEELVECPVDIISTGPHRDETIVVREVI
jgi:adenylosuccinate synthase